METGTCPTCGSCDVLFQYGGRCADPFHNPAIIAAMERQLLADVESLPIYIKDDCDEGV